VDAGGLGSIVNSLFWLFLIFSMPDLQHACP
jgi:hypothetical protein